MSNYQLAEPLFLRNLILLPIEEGKNGPKTETLKISTIDEVIGLKKGRFRELDLPQVNKIVFENNGDSPVLMLDGEEITGSLQNRIIAASSFVEPRASKNIRVLCAEEKRWDEIGGFRSGYCSYPKIRSILCQGLHKKIDIQQTIWREIERKLTKTKTISRTSSMHDIYDNLEDEVSRYAEGFESLNHHTIGFIGVAGNQILGCDLFHSPDIYHKFEEKLVRSYALDALEYHRTRSRLLAVEDFFDSIIAQLPSTTKTRAKNLRIKGKDFLGQALVCENRILHLSAFPT